jgi:hypothetical protein
MARNDQACPWPEIIMRSFFVASASNATSEKPFYGSWNRLVTLLVPPDTIFEVVPQYLQWDRGGTLSTSSISM